MQEAIDVYLCAMIMDVITPSNCCKEWLKKDVPKSCPYRMEHVMQEWNDEKED